MSEPYIDCTVEETSLRRIDGTIDRFAAVTGRDQRDIVEQQSKLFVRDVMKDIAPFDHGGYGESWGAQRKIGMAAVARDIRKVWTPLEDLVVIKNANTPQFGVRMQRYIDNGQFDYLRMILPKLEPAINRDSIKNPDSATVQSIHHAQRDKRGHVRQGTRRFFTAGRVIESYIKRTQSFVGWLKSGFGAAAVRLGVSVPAWALRGGSHGRVELNLSFNDPFVRMVNDIPYAVAGRVNAACERALEGRAIAMEAQIKAKLQGAWERAGGGREAA